MMELVNQVKQIKGHGRAPEPDTGSDPGADNEPNARATNNGNGTMNYGIRLSRLNHPRGTLVAMVLLAAVFLLFGVFAYALHPELVTQTPETTSDVLSMLTTLC